MTRQNPWLAHVRRYRAQHGGTYHDALKGARASYRNPSEVPQVPTLTQNGEHYVLSIPTNEEKLILLQKDENSYVTKYIQFKTNPSTLNQVVIEQFPVLNKILGPYIGWGWFGIYSKYHEGDPDYIEIEHERSKQFKRIADYTVEKKGTSVRVRLTLEDLGGDRILNPHMKDRDGHFKTFE